MIKVAILTDYIPPHKMGGLGVLAYNLHQYYKDNIKDIETTLITTGELKSNKNDIINLSKSINIGYFINSIRRLPKILNDFDVIHIHQSLNSPLVLFNKRKKVLVTFHTSKKTEYRHIPAFGKQEPFIYRSKGELMQKYCKMPYNILVDSLLAKKADAITAVSQQTKDEVYEDYLPKKNKEIKVVHNGIDTEKFNPKAVAGKIKERYKLADCKLILYAGTFKARKRFFSLLSCFKDILKGNKDVRLLVAGPKNRLSRKISHDLNLDNYIIFLEDTSYENIAQVYASADMVVIPSSYEGLPLVALEAMSMAKPIIATSAGGTKEVIKDGENGLLVAIDNIEQLKNKILLLLSDSKVREALAKNARKTVQDSYDLKHCALKYADIYQKLA
jgi:glycosyltransferase involved in cell wall biosynthesis